ncbi:MAG: DUF2225 domain-containing protein, partial [Candidatus Hydrogenedentes bacterium]|nr:DUF2225 domain-containing protein [Candidatus Hydrogenedentota bacterium]
MKHVCVFVAAMLFVAAADATTWADSEMTDPLTGKKVPSKEIMSYGGYIYNWPSKYDLVFWPLTDENWICLNPENGYAAFNDDFEELSKQEKETLKSWLVANYNPSEAPKSYEQKLDWLERVYRQRKKDDAFWCTFYRLMAYTHREHREKSLVYVKKAIPLLEAQLKKNPKDIDRIEVLFSLGEYYRRTGETA